jgi:branched-chain amino acid transport system ATP-binding protein
LPALVEVHDVSKSFGSVAAVRGVSLTLHEGEALGIVGPNGAGKTTVLNLIGGTLKPDRGRIVFDGRDITRLPSHHHCRVGIGRTFQVPRPFGGLTAYENVLVAYTYGTSAGRARAESTCMQVLERVRLADKANAVASSLTLLERKRLEIARAVATNPRVLLLDEVAGGLTEPEVNALVATITDLREQGIAIVWIEHVVHALLSVVDRMLALAEGRNLIEGEPREVMASPVLRDVYLGREL